MLKTAIRAAAGVIVYLLVGGLAAWNGAEILGRFGAFGSGHDRAMGVLLIGFPALWLVFFLLLFMIRKWPLGSVFDGCRGFVPAVLVFIVVCVGLYAGVDWALTMRVDAPPN